VTCTFIGRWKGRVEESGRGLEDDDVHVLPVIRALILLHRTQGEVKCVMPGASIGDVLMLNDLLDK
jgi:hypothetical protein